MNNSPYLDRPLLSERERRLVDALRRYHNLFDRYAQTLHWPDKAAAIAATRASHQAQAILDELSQ